MTLKPGHFTYDIHKPFDEVIKAITTVNNSVWYELRCVTRDNIIELRAKDGSEKIGVPIIYALEATADGKRIWFYPTPSKAYSVTLRVARVFEL